VEPQPGKWRPRSGHAMRIGYVESSVMGLTRNLLFGCACAAAIWASTATADATVRRGHLLARQYVAASTGGAVATRQGIQLYVPPGTMKRDGYLTITAFSHHRYDLHIAAPWSGSVRVTLPLRSKTDAIIHRLGNVWVPEGTRRGFRPAWVVSSRWCEPARGLRARCGRVTARRRSSRRERSPLRST
jgi:hypothetical protein